MGDGYYPKYYQKKKSRDQIFLNVWRVVLFVVLLGIGYLVGATAFSLFPMGRKTSGVADLAQKKEELEIQRDEDQASQAQVATPDSTSDNTIPVPKANLDEIGYTVSQPAVHVAIEGVAPGESTDPHEIDDDPADGDSPDGDGSNEDTDPASNSSGRPVVDPDRITRDSTEKPADKPAEPIKPVETETNTKPPEQPKEEPKPKPKPTGAKTYKVFAGYYYTKEEAVSRKKDLSTLGFSGKVLEGAGTYSIFVTELSDSDSGLALQEKLIANGFSDSFVVENQN